MDVSYGVIPVSSLSKRVLLVQSHRGEWGFPKGGPEDADESEVATALRELQEETGVTACTVDPKDFYESRYTYEQDGVEHAKMVRFYTGIVTDEFVKPREGEIQAVRWCTYDEAMNLLSFQDAKLALETIKHLLV